MFVNRLRIPESAFTTSKRINTKKLREGVKVINAHDFFKWNLKRKRKILEISRRKHEFLEAYSAHKKYAYTMESLNPQEFCFDDLNDLSKGMIDLLSKSKNSNI